MSLIYLQTSFSSGYIHRDKVSYPHSDLVGRKGENLLGCCYFIKIFISYAAVFPLFQSALALFLFSFYFFFALFIHSANFVTYPPPVPLPTSGWGSTAPTRRSFTKVLLPKIGRSNIIHATELRLSMLAALIISSMTGHESTMNLSGIFFVTGSVCGSCVYYKDRGTKEQIFLPQSDCFFIIHGQLLIISGV